MLWKSHSKQWKESDAFQNRVSPWSVEGAHLPHWFNTDPMLFWPYPCIQRGSTDSTSGSWSVAAGQHTGTKCHQPQLLGWFQGSLFNSPCQQWISSQVLFLAAWHWFRNFWNTMGAWFLSPYKDSSSALFLIPHPKDKTLWWIKVSQQLARFQTCMPWSFIYL